MKEKITLCGANSYKKKYYFNPDFELLPEQIKKELKMLCVGFTEKVGGILTLDYNSEGNLEFSIAVADEDIYFDEIESGIQLGCYQREYKELLEQLELYCKSRLNNFLD